MHGTRAHPKRGTPRERIGLVFAFPLALAPPPFFAAAFFFLAIFSSICSAGPPRATSHHSRSAAHRERPRFSSIVDLLFSSYSHGGGARIYPLLLLFLPLVHEKVKPDAAPTPTNDQGRQGVGANHTDDALLFFCLLPSCSCSSAGNARRRPTARRRGRQRSGPGAGGRAAAKGRRPGRLLHPVRLLVVLARAGRRTTLPADAAVAWPHRRALVLTIPLVLLMCRARQIGLPGPHGDHHLRRLPRRMRRRLWQLPR